MYSSFAVMFAPEDTVKTVEIPIIDDAMHEADESFTTQLIQGFQSYLTFGKRDGVVTITDNDPTPTVTIATAETTEGGTLEFAVTLSNPTVGEAIIGYHVEMDGAIVGAGPDADLRQKSGLLIIPKAIPKALYRYRPWMIAWWKTRRGSFCTLIMALVCSPLRCSFGERSSITISSSRGGAMSKYPKAICRHKRARCARCKTLSARAMPSPSSATCNAARPVPEDRFSHDPLSLFLYVSWACP